MTTVEPPGLTPREAILAMLAAQDDQSVRQTTDRLLAAGPEPLLTAIGE